MLGSCGRLAWRRDIHRATAAVTMGLAFCNLIQTNNLIVLCERQRILTKDQLNIKIMKKNFMTSVVENIVLKRGHIGHIL